MSKYQEEFDKWFKENCYGSSRLAERIWQAAWNIRGRVDAEICREWGNARKDNYGGNALRNCAEAIEKEQV